MTHSENTKVGPNPSGYCLCGCGQRTPLAPYNHQCGWVKGQPTSYIKGHNGSKSPVHYIVDEQTGCWVWQRTINHDGYGMLVGEIDGVRKTMAAHRYYWHKANGSVPEGMELDHLCRNRACCNPDHLEPVTRKENQRRSPYRKLNPDLVAEMRQLRESGWTLIRLSEKFHVSIPVVSKICRYETWL